MLRKLLITCIALGSVSFAAAAAGEPNLDKLKAALGGATPDSVTPGPVSGLYEIIVAGQVLYLSEDGQFAIQGDIVDLGSARNVTELRRSALRAEAVEKVGENNMIVFPPEKPAKHTVTIFTDIDCGYCRKLHREIASYHQNSIKVRYLMFPRAGIGSESYKKAVAVWCSKDRRDALTRAKRGEAIKSKSCSNPVEAHYTLGQNLGVQGTPSIVFDNGRMVPGYMPAERLVQLLNDKRASN